MQTGSPKTVAGPLPGLAVACVIAAVAFLFSLTHIALDPLVLSILISIIVGNLLGASERFTSVIPLSHRVLIPAGIVLYGSQMDVRPLSLFGIGHVVFILLTVGITVTALYAVSRRIGLQKELSLLLSAGTAICGASAIMVLSPVVRAKKEDTSVALLAITVLGLAGVVLYPLAQELFSLSERTYALLCGSTLGQLGQVKAAAALMSEAAASFAVPLKLLRIATLLPVAVIYSLITDDRPKKTFIPWFIVGSLAVAVAVNLLPALGAFRTAAAPYVTLLFSVAIASIGLTVNLESIIDAGPRPFLAAFLGWFILLALFLLGRVLLG